jgi:glycosyltransferase involved in cell wall biosynthesis
MKATFMPAAEAHPVPPQPRDVPAYDIARWQGRRSSACVVIPVINEGARIGRLLDRMAAIGIAEQADIVIVDGGSTDGSLDGQRLDAAGVAALLVKTGPGRLSAQLRCAYDFALRQGYDQFVTIDGNDKDDPDPIPAFIAALRAGTDFVQASRFLPGGIEENTPWKRRLAVRLVHAPILSIASRFRWTDTTQGFRGYSRRMLADPRLAIFRPVFLDYELLAYLNYRAPRLGFHCLEMATARRYPKGEAVPTKISLGGELRLLGVLLAAATGRFDPD